MPAVACPMLGTWKAISRSPNVLCRAVLVAIVPARPRVHQLSNTAYMCGRSLADRCQRAGCDARYSPLRVCLLERDDREPPSPSASAVFTQLSSRKASSSRGRGRETLGPIRWPPPWRAARPRRGCAPSPYSPADRETPRHSHRCGHRSERHTWLCCSCLPLSALSQWRGQAGRERVMPRTTMARPGNCACGSGFARLEGIASRQRISRL